MEQLLKKGMLGDQITKFTGKYIWNGGIQTFKSCKLYFHI